MDLIPATKTTNNMTENKLYAQCISEATEQIIQKLGNISEFDYAKINQLTSEIYGMKLLDKVPKADLFYHILDEKWCYWGSEEPIGSTKDLHDHFVQEFNKEEGR